MFPEIEKFFPEFQLDAIEKEDTIKIRLSTILVDQPFYDIKIYTNKDLNYLKSKCADVHWDVCVRIHHFYKGLCKHDPEKANKLKDIDWTKYVKKGNIVK